MRSRMTLSTVLIAVLAACEHAPTAVEAAADRQGTKSLPFPLASFVIPTQTDGNNFFAGITNGPDGNVWFTENAVDLVGRVTPTGDMVEFPLPRTGAEPVEMITGPDGNLWISEYGVNAIARMTTAGAVTEFALPSELVAENDSGPRGLVTAPDGNIWFVHPAGWVGKMSPSGALLAVYATPSPLSGALIVVLGPDGALWFTEANSGRIGRITMQGTITEYPTGAANSVPIGIVAGRDGAMWFTDRGANAIGRVTMTGAVTEFPLPTPNASVNRMSVSPDGSLWFAETNHGNGQLGRVLYGGGKAANIKEWALPAPSLPFATDVGPGGQLWFTDGVGAIGRVTVGGE